MSAVVAPGAGKAVREDAAFQVLGKRLAHIGLGAAVVALAVAAWPSAANTATSATAPAAFIVVGEAIVGLGLGASLAAVFAAAGWAGTLLGSVSGLSWADDFTPEADSQSAGIARLAW